MSRFSIATVVAVVVAFVLSTVGLSADPAPRTVAIKAGDDMKFSVTEIVAKRGEKLRVVLSSRGTMPKMAMAHNFVLLAKGTDVDAFANASAIARDAEYVAPALVSKVLAATKLAGNGETVDIVFDAPKAPGRYDFICSFPGHYLGGMRGVLVVK
jgi:azurin